MGLPLGSSYLFPGFYLLTIEDALANYAAFVANLRLDSKWLPVRADGGGDFYVIELGGGLAGSVRRFRIDESQHPIQFESLGAMFETIARGFESSVFFVNRNGYLDMDGGEISAVAAALNPLVPWWNDSNV